MKRQWQEIVRGLHDRQSPAQTRARLEYKLGRSFHIDKMPPCLTELLSREITAKKGPRIYTPQEAVERLSLIVRKLNRRPSIRREESPLSDYLTPIAARRIAGFWGRSTLAGQFEPAAAVAQIDAKRFSQKNLHEALVTIATSHDEREKRNADKLCRALMWHRPDLITPATMDLFLGDSDPGREEWREPQSGPSHRDLRLHHIQDPFLFNDVTNLLCRLVKRKPEAFTSAHLKNMAASWNNERVPKKIMRTLQQAYSRIHEAHFHTAQMDFSDYPGATGFARVQRPPEI